MIALTLLELATMATDEPDPVEGSTRTVTCRKCNDEFSLLDGFDPCPLCNDCAHEIARILGDAVVRLYAHLDTLPVIVAQPIKYAIDHGLDGAAQQFIETVVRKTTERVTRARRGRHKK